MTIDICVWDKCNNRCRMCTNPTGTWPAWDGSFDYSLPAIIKRLEKRKDEIREMESIYLSGGEPTLNPDFLDLLRYLKDNFPEQRVKLLTNGRRFAYEDFAKKTMEINSNFEIDLSIYGPNDELHEKVTLAKNSFKQTLQGLSNLLKYRSSEQVVGVRTVITGLSYQHIDEMLELVSKKFSGIDRVVLIFWEPEAQAVINKQEVEVNYDEVLPYLNKISSDVLSKFRDLRFYHFPLCRLPQKLWPFMWCTLPEDEISFLPACEKCNYQKYCVGIHKGYLENVKDDNFRAITENFKIISSGFQYRPIDSVE